MAKRLYKIEAGRKLFGVCGGLAEHFNIDVVLVRIVWLVFALFYGAGILLYFVAALVLPNKSEIEV
ncbi:MAG TPA: PspC domain-containing protein [Treponemataceae bacterium]|nr:PspC domain-containing protein [Treponemataceae bacterium]HQB87648.1 PspC domain-containing protein [Treponemataceae bacterium]